MTPATFRAAFPEFSDAVIYPDPQVSQWLTVAAKMVNADRWDDLTDLGQQLFTAHHLAMAIADQKTAAAGGVPGKVSGALNSKAVDKVSASYDVSAVTYADAGFWNMTSYGIRFYAFMMMFGAGGIQL